MQSPRFAIASLVTGVAAWVQLVLAPTLTGPFDVLSLLAALLALGVLTSAAVLAERHPERALALALGAYPIALGVAAVCTGRHVVPRYDAPLRVLGALTTLAYFAFTLRWHRSRTAQVPVLCAAAEPRSVAPAPRLRTPAFVALGVVAFALAVVFPAWLGARDATTMAERLGGEALARGRASIVSAAGMMLALLVVLQGGSTLLRSTPTTPRLTSRAAFYVLWAGCAYLMRSYLGHDR